ncbi:WXG100 family type VII secretion target [Kitasatospora sp. NPDC051170]|uniref:WXG100 family type VII secretion target n=1 Tax=Kitasatospora sp. NPDC051170 TaxID=3364056 RepID=UPI00379E11A0
MPETTEKDQNPWLYGQDAPPASDPFTPPRATGPWVSTGNAGPSVLVQPDVLHRAAEESRRLRGELKSSVGRVEPDTAAAVQALTDGWASGPALSQALTWWKTRWNSLDNRLGLAADRLDSTARSYHGADASAATTFQGP